MKLKDIKLKTCPFCDGEGEIIHSKLYGLPFSSSSGLISLLRNSLRQSCQLEVK